MSGSAWSESRLEMNAANEAASNVKIVYFLYLSSILVGFTALIGLVMAYVNRKECPAWLQTHYRFQIRTFWIGMFLWVPALMLLVALLIFSVFEPLLMVLAYPLIWVLGVAWLVWLVVRCVRGLKALSSLKSCPKPASWL